MKYLQIFEKFTSLSDDEKIQLHKIVDKIKEGSTDMVTTNSEVSKPSGVRKLQGLGQPFASIIPGSVSKDSKIITAEVEHGMEYESGRKVELKSTITLDTSDMTHDIQKK